MSCSLPTGGDPKSPPTPGPGADPHRTLSVRIGRLDAKEESTVTWTLVELVTAIGWHAAADAAWAFVVGEKADYLVITTAGPEGFMGQYPLWGEEGKYGGWMFFDGLTLSEVFAVLEKFYAGRRAEACFAPHSGRFQSYRENDPKGGQPT